MDIDDKINRILYETRRMDRVYCTGAHKGQHFREAYSAMLREFPTDGLVQRHMIVHLLFPGTSKMERWCNHYTYSDMLHPWSFNKVTYTFDHDVEDAILSTNFENVPLSVMDHLPYSTVFINLSDDVCERVGSYFESKDEKTGDMKKHDPTHQPIIGFFFTNKMREAQEHHAGVSIGIVTAPKNDDGIAVWPIHLGRPENYNNIKLKEYVEWLTRDLDTDENSDADVSCDILTVTFAYIAYLCSKNAEIDQTERNKKIYRPNVLNPYPLPKHRYTEVNQMT